MHSFQYINPIRDEKGELRDWNDYTTLSNIEEKLDYGLGPDSIIEYKHKFIENERSKIQNGVQKVR